MPRKRHEEHTNHEAWAIPYGDLITLLLAFFVVMYALSSVNEGKYRLLSDSLYAAFRGTPRTMEPVQVGDNQTVGPGADSRTGVLQQQHPQAQGTQPLVQPVKLATQTPNGTASPEAAPAAPEAAAAGPSPADRAALAHIADQVESALADLVRNNVVAVHRSDLWVEVELRTDILFPSGSARLAPNAVTVLAQLAQVLAPLPNAVRVEGHTDNVPIRNANFYSNWELSAARAGSVVHVLSANGVAPGRLAVVGFGEQRPKQSNDTAQGRNANRRVVVVILATDGNHPNDPLGMMRTTPSAEAAPIPSAASAPPAPEARVSTPPAPEPSAGSAAAAAPNAAVPATPPERSQAQ